MNFSPFGSHFSAAIPGIHQFAAKFNHDSGSASNNNSNMNNISHSNGNLSIDESMLSGNNRYSNPRSTAGSHFMLNQHAMTAKYHREVSSQMVNNATCSSKYPNSDNSLTTVHHYAIPYNGNPNVSSENRSSQQELKRTPSSSYSNNQEQIQNDEIGNLMKRECKDEDYSSILQHQQPAMPPTWQSIAAPGSTVADYLSHLPASTLPISLHHFLKYSADIKKDAELSETNGDNVADQVGQLGVKKKKKKKGTKEKKPRPKPGEIRLTTALDGSTLYCCPECQMAYPDKSLLEQHLLGHTMERRFFCDICGAGLKRKDHLTRHKQSHNPDRPFVCTVCMKAFKRKEQLTLHFVIHSGEKRHVCPECGKGFYRKDHLRKHTRSHIARRVKAELSQHVATNNPPGTNDPLS